MCGGLWLGMTVWGENQSSRASAGLIPLSSLPPLHITFDLTLPYCPYFNHNFTLSITLLASDQSNNTTVSSNSYLVYNYWASKAQIWMIVLMLLFRLNVFGKQILLELYFIKSLSASKNLRIYITTEPNLWPVGPSNIIEIQKNHILK